MPVAVADSICGRDRHGAKAVLVGEQSRNSFGQGIRVASWGNDAVDPIAH